MDSSLKHNSFTIFSKYKDLICVISTRESNSMKTNGKFQDKNINNFFKPYKIKKESIMFMDQVHGSRIAAVSKKNLGNLLPCDGIITSEKNIYLCVLTADCLPVIFYDPVMRIVGAAHAGYKGILAGIIENMLKIFLNSGSKVKNITVAIGPSIGVCCYNVDKNRINKFIKKFGNIPGMYKKENNESYLNLKQVVVKLLQRYKVKNSNIEVLPICTKCNINKFYSYRGDSKNTFGEFMTFAGMI